MSDPNSITDEDWAAHRLSFRPKYELLKSVDEVRWANQHIKHPDFSWKLGDTLPERETALLREWRNAVAA